jgi:hypothetical protein
VLFHYTGDPTFHLIVAEGLSENTLAMLQPDGKGIYLSGHAPIELWRALGAKEEGETTHTKHCIPFIVPEEMLARVEGGGGEGGLPNLPDLWLLSAATQSGLVTAAAAGSVRRKRAMVRRYEAILGPAHPTCLAAMNELSFLLESEGLVTEAVELGRRLLKVSEETLGSNHLATLTNVANLAYLLESEGSKVEAEALARRALEGREAVLGKDHADTNVSVNNLAHLLEAVGKVEEAQSLFLRELEWCKATYGARSPQVRESQRNYSRFCKQHEIGEEFEKKRMRRKRYATGPQIGGDFSKV